MYNAGGLLLLGRSPIYFFVVLAQSAASIVEHETLATFTEI